MRLALTLAWKDLHIEMRSKKMLTVILLFSFVLVLVGSFTYRWQVSSITYLLPLLWLVSVFTQLLFLSEAYHHEIADGCFDALRMSPVRGFQLLVGKLLASLALVLSVNIAVMLEIAIFATAPELLRLELFALLVLETIGLLAIGNLFFARIASGESTNLDVFPIVVILSVPLLFVAVDISQLSLLGRPPADQALPYTVLIVYDLFLVGCSSLAYRSMIDD